nr:hypothetical protein [Phycisphaeraceae bacterium]
RDFCYSPFQQKWNTDSIWNGDADGAGWGFSFITYMALAGNAYLTLNNEVDRVAVGVKGMGEWVPNGIQPVHDSLDDKAESEVFIADVTRSINNNLEPSTHIRGSDPTGFLPKTTPGGGAHVGHIDGSVRWKPEGEMGQPDNLGRRRYFRNNLRIYW